MNTVYHYCSIDTFLKIIQKKTLRLSDIGKSNDYAERLYIENRIHEELLKRVENVLSTEEMEVFRRVEEMCRKTMQTTHNLYAICFSEEKDLLSQWRGYASDGKGVAIGFSKDILNGVNEEEYGLVFRKVCYEESQQKEFIERQVDTIINTMSYKNLFAACAEVYENAIESIGCMKSPGFSEEKEWRLCKAVAPQMLVDHGTEFRGFVISKIQEQCIRDQIVTYIDLSFEDVLDNFVKEIVIGPSAKVTEVDIYRSLNINGIPTNKIRVTKSKITYR